MMTTEREPTDGRFRRTSFAGVEVSCTFAAARALGVVCGLILVGLEAVATAQTSDLAVISPEHSMPEEAYLGSLSCSSVSCHGDPRRTNVVGSAAHYFLDRDKHQLAGAVLYGERSQLIGERLKLSQPVWKTRECLVCHAPAAIGAADTPMMVADGVGCESCHGPARQWLSSHRSVEWKRTDFWTNPRKAATGFRDTKELVSRADLCADCHVGNANQSVNHDLIAAGHPRLHFEFAAYQSRMPRHWRQAPEHQPGSVSVGSAPTNQSASEVRNWMVGQIVTAEHELEILSAAARRSTGPWPELSQYDCFACHHDVSSPGWRQSRTAWNLRPGEFQWGTWGLGLLAEVQPGFANVLNDRFTVDQDSLLHVMKSMRADRNQALMLAESLQQQLERAQSEFPKLLLTRDEVAAVRDSVLKQSESMINQGWDRSAQLYLASIALDEDVNAAVGAGDHPDLARVESYVRLRGLLSYQDARSAGPAFDHRESPIRFDANRRVILEAFRQLLEPTDLRRGLSPLPVPLEND
ncbi:MAG: hypothetical protein JSS49_05135 [Planctomycetes bacterium]|nr:hypothetical protein [Planctomycetota bacterium]